MGNVRGAPRRSAAAQAASVRAAEDRKQEQRSREVERASAPTPSPTRSVLYVYDTTAAPQATRIHDVIAKKDARGQILTKSYPLSNEKPCEMPAAHALQFLRDDAFIVCTDPVPEEREESRLRPVKARSENVNVIALTENETIADWSELSDEALVRRAHAFPSADKPNDGASRAELVVFLTEASRVKKTDGDRLADDDQLEGMGGDELNSLFGDDRRAGIDRDLPGSRTRVRPNPAAAKKPS